MDVAIALVLLKSLLEAEKESFTHEQEKVICRLADKHKSLCDTHEHTLNEMQQVVLESPFSEAILSAHSITQRAVVELEHAKGYEEGYRQGLEQAMGLIVQSLEDAKFPANLK